MTSKNHHQDYSVAEYSLEIKNLVKRYGGLAAVNDVTLDIEKGEMFALLGPSGCGKTTLLRCIAGLEQVDQGQIVINAQPVNQIPPYKRDCSTVFQQNTLFPHMTVFDNIAFGLVERRVSKNAIKKRVGDMIDLVNLNGLEDRLPHQLSGGQQQRVALVRSLVINPAILLLDEPLAALDRKLRKEMQVELKRIQREVGITFLHVTHDQKEALSLSDRIGVMNSGRVVQLGTPDEIYERPRNWFVADFMGAVNLFEGKTLPGKNGNTSFVTTDGLVLPLQVNGINDPDRVEGVSVHPEIIRIARNAAEAGSLETEAVACFRAIIRDVFYQGDASELCVVLTESKRELTLSIARGSDPNKDLRTGVEVFIYWDSAHTNALFSA